MILFYLERVQFFRKVLENLEDAGKESYEALCTKCKEVGVTITTRYPSLPYTDVAQLQHLGRDNFSQSLMPRDLPGMVALKCYGDGNCLYRLVSVIATRISLKHCVEQ